MNDTWQSKQHIADIAKISYNAILVIGFCLFRDFFNSNLPPSIGASICVIATILYNSYEWFLYKIKHIEPMPCPVLFCMSLAITLDYIFPLVIWLSLTKNNLFLSLVTGLSAKTLIQTYLKHDIKSPHNPSLLKYSLFTPKQKHINQEDTALTASNKSISNA